MRKIIISLMAVIMLIGVMPVSAANEDKVLELPIEGTTGYTLIDCNMRAGDSSKTKRLAVIPAGTPYTILREGDSYFYGRCENGQEGWISKTYTMVNLPDIIPSIVYSPTNATGSMFKSLGVDIDGVTGESLYTGKTFNARLGCDEFMVPVLYSMAMKIASAQRAALADGNTLVIYEGYRPSATQLAVSNGLEGLMSRNSKVRAAITGKPWNKSWFINTGVSNHQKGFAIDVSLASVESMTWITVGDNMVPVVDSWTEYKMPTPMHELSPLAARYTTPVASHSSTAWKKAVHAASFNQAALTLEKYLTNKGLTPLASEWWHFNDLDAYRSTGNAGSGSFCIEKVLSIVL